MEGFRAEVAPLEPDGSLQCPQQQRVPFLRNVSIAFEHPAKVCIETWRTPQKGLSNSASLSLRCVIGQVGRASASNSRSEKLSYNLVGVDVHQQL